MQTNSNNFRFPLLMAWRETRAAPGKFIFVVLSVALGAAALTAVTGFNENPPGDRLAIVKRLCSSEFSFPACSAPLRGFPLHPALPKTGRNGVGRIVMAWRPASSCPTCGRRNRSRQFGT